MSPKTHDKSQEDSGGSRPRGFVSRQLDALKAYCIERLGLEEIQALAAHKRVPIASPEHFLFLGRDGAVLVRHPGDHRNPAFALLQGIARPGVRKRARIMTEIDYGWLIRSIHSWSAEPVGRRAPPAPPDHVYHARLSASAGSDLGDRTSSAGRILRLRLQRIPAPVEPVGVFCDAGGDADHGCSAGDRQADAARGAAARRSPAIRWLDSTRCTWSSCPS